MLLDERELLAMRFVAGLSSAAIGEALRITPVGARSRVHRVIGKLRRELVE